MGRGRGRIVSGGRGWGDYALGRIWPQQGTEPQLGSLKSLRWTRWPQGPNWQRVAVRSLSGGLSVVCSRGIWSFLSLGPVGTSDHGKGLLWPPRRWTACTLLGAPDQGRPMETAVCGPGRPSLVAPGMP